MCPLNWFIYIGFICQNVSLNDQSRYSVKGPHIHQVRLFVTLTKKKKKVCDSTNTNTLQQFTLKLFDSLLKQNVVFRSLSYLNLNKMKYHHS